LGKPLLKFFRHTVRWPIEAALAYIFIGLLRLLPPSVSSAVMAALMGVIGPLTPAHRHSLFNIGFAMPELSEAERKKIRRKMWLNLGRIIGEYPHINRLMKSGRIQIDGMDNLELLRKTGGFIISAHIGNWEVASIPAIKAGLTLNCIYRPMNNPYLSRFLERRLKTLNITYKKGTEGARGMVATIKHKQVMAMVVDQKLREGEMVKFFGHDASTAVSYLKLVQNKNLPILLSRVIRTGGCNFKIVVTPLDLTKFDRNSPDFIIDAAAHINAIIEGWIREYPEQWLWPHRRWPESKGEV
jgi:KDO2-lipid IV(A) lauroyltransferase